MPIEVMDVKASDNVYLHRDFHGALSVGIEYLHKNYGEQAVIDYLQEFTRTYYAPLIEKIKAIGLGAIKEHYEKMLRTEGVVFDVELSDNQLCIRLTANTPVQHMRTNGYKVADMFVNTITTVNDALCEGSNIAASLEDYNNETGTGVMKFTRK